jgi:hypothetical protein
MRAEMRGHAITARAAAAAAADGALGTAAVLATYNPRLWCNSFAIPYSALPMS